MSENFCFNCGNKLSKLFCNKCDTSFKIIKSSDIELTITCNIVQQLEHHHPRKYYYSNIPHLGNIAVSRHAQSRLDEYKISQSIFEDILYNGKETKEGFNILHKDSHGIRLIIILNPDPPTGAKLISTIIKLKPTSIK